MALQPGFFTGPPPQAVKATVTRGGDVFYGINPDMNRWIQNLWNWTVKFGNNADGAASFSGSIAIGTSPNWFKADASGIWLGGATFAASPFRVSMAGALTATNVSVTGGDITTTGHVLASGEYDGGFTTLAAVTGSSTSAGNYSGVLGVASGTNAMGVKGYHSSASGAGRGVEGRTGSTDSSAVGVLAVASQNTAVALWVKNEAISGSPKVAEFASQTGTGSVNMNALTLACGAINGVTVSGSGTALTTTSSAGSFPTLNQNTTGSAATITTARTINGVSFNGSANITTHVQTSDGANSRTLNWTGDPGANCTALGLIAGVTQNATPIGALNWPTGGSNAWGGWLQVWTGSGTIYIPYAT